MKPQHFAVLAGSLLVVALVLVIMGRPQTAPTGSAASLDRQMTVVSEGEVRAKPNLVKIVLGVMATGSTASEAETESITAAARVRAALVASGVEEAGVEVAQPVLSALTGQDFSGQIRIHSFQGRSRLVALLRNPVRLQGAIDAALGAGATSLEEVSFTLENPEEAKLQAIARALKAARERAAAMASAEGRKLGGLLQLEVLEEPVAVSSASISNLVYRARVRATFEF